MLKYITGIFIIMLAFSCVHAQKWYSGDSTCNWHGRFVLGRKAVLKYDSKHFPDTAIDTTGAVVKNEHQLISVAEPVLFKTYGKRDIKGERPYEIYYVNGYWILMGTLPKGYLGGTANIVINAKNGAVVSMWHEK